MAIVPDNTIRINDQWRICFLWKDADAYDVEIVDYHRGSEEMKRKKLQPVHPGEVLQQEFLNPMGLSQNKLALNIAVTARRINEIVLKKRKITADTTLRLASFFKLLLNSGLACNRNTIAILLQTNSRSAS